MPRYIDAAAFTLFEEERPGIVVALHGLSATRDQPLDYLKGFDVPQTGILAPDLRGHGDTEFLGTPEDFTPTQLCTDVDTLIRHLGLGSKKLMVLGISLGATVALELMRRATFDIVAAVFIRPAHGVMPAHQLAINASIASYLREGPERALDRLLASPEYREVAAVSARAAASLRNKVMANRAAERAMRLDRGATWTAFGPDESIADPPPSLVIAARNDPLHPIVVAREWQRRLAGSSWSELPSRDAEPGLYAALARATVQEFLGRWSSLAVSLL